MASIDQVAADVTAETTVIDSISTLIGGLETQLAAALAGAGIPADVQAKIDAVFATAETNKAKLAAAVLAGTPVQPAPVAASPQVAAAAAAKKL